MAKKTIGAGFHACHYGVNNADGIFIGGTTTVPPAGNTAGSAMLRLDGGRIAPLSIPESEIETVLGDDEPEVTFEWDSAELTSGILETSPRDNVFDALIQGTLIQEIGDIELSAYDPKGRIAQPMCLLVHRLAKSWLSGERGSKKWELRYILSCTIKPLLSNVEQRTHSPYRYSLNLSRGDVGFGMSINETDHGTTAMSIQVVDSDNPMARHRFTGDGATLTYFLTYPVISSAKTYVFVNQILQATPGDYACAGTSLIFVAAPANDAVIDVIYEVEESDIF